MQRFPKYGLCGVHVFLVLILDRCPCKAKEECTGEGRFDGDEHIAKGAAVAFVYNEHHVLALYLFEFLCSLR